MRVIEQTLLSPQLEYINSLPEVSAAYLKLQEGLTKVDFTVSLPISVKERILDILQLNLFTVDKVPCRWIQGDTAPHVDRGSADFENTYLVYLTSGEGQFQLGDESYPIVAGTGFSFSEGTSHEVTGTNGTARLLLGPMSEQGFPVGGFGIYADGATEIAYIRDNAGTIEFKINDGEWQTVFFACYVGNSNPDPTNNILKVIFTTDITLTSWNQNFWAGTNGIQFGSEKLEENGIRPVISVVDAPLFRGVFLNGTDGGVGYNDIYVYNLRVEATGTSTLDDGTYLGPGGWICGAYFGTGATNNVIINCSSYGPIGDQQGGIVGAYAGSEAGATLFVYGCSSYGPSTDTGGNIMGSYAGSSAGQVYCEQCWSEGTIGGGIGFGGGGIFGGYAGSGAGYASASKCYSLGEIGQGGGGIFGGYAADDSGIAAADTCYSAGFMNASAGGIFGRVSGGGASATNCYTTGDIGAPGQQAGGIFGEYASGEPYNANNCYTAGALPFGVASGYIFMDNDAIPSSCQSEAFYGGPGWVTIHANLALQGIPSGTGVGTYWVYTGVDQPYELNGMGYSPYTLTNITTASEPNQSFSQTIAPGQTTAPAVIVNTDPSGNDFTILQVTGGDEGSYSTITMDSQTGAISTTAYTVQGTYSITLRSIGSYNITIYILLVTGETPPEPEPEPTPGEAGCCQSETLVRDISYTWLNDYRIGYRLIAESNQNPNLKFNGYSEYVKYKMALGSGKL